MTTTDEPVTLDPAVARVVAAINAGDRRAFLSALAPRAVLTDDGTPRPLADWVEREIFSADGRLTVERADADGRELVGRFRNLLWGEMRTYWRFDVVDGAVTRIETGQA
ncbi:hypothetical protein [Isoptericola sp. NPDC056134]|uniref:hypothetical protein n=1 Tax=Isoptericola sp. NPDC056134 TaxID=3345723 RepID=UPI0035EDCEC7